VLETEVYIAVSPNKNTNCYFLLFRLVIIGNDHAIKIDSLVDDVAHLVASTPITERCKEKAMNIYNIYDLFSLLE